MIGLGIWSFTLKKNLIYSLRFGRCVVLECHILYAKVVKDKNAVHRIMNKNFFLGKNAQTMLIASSNVIKVAPKFGCLRTDANQDDYPLRISHTIEQGWQDIAFINRTNDPEHIIKETIFISFRNVTTVHNKD
jgi:hypothetical protein